VAAADRSGMPVSVAAIDIDDFKAVNDAFTHAGGDEVLRGVARCLKGATRLGDIVTRVGGEEFVVVLVNASAEDAATAWERLREAVRVRQWPPPFGGLRTSVSVGLTTGEGEAAQRSCGRRRTPCSTRQNGLARTASLSPPPAPRAELLIGRRFLSTASRSGAHPSNDWPPVPGVAIVGEGVSCRRSVWPARWRGSSPPPLLCALRGARAPELIRLSAPAVRRSWSAASPGGRIRADDHRRPRGSP
jgi:hypothetical protein